MMTTRPSLLTSIKLMTKHYIAAEFSSKERVLSPLLFALTILVLFSFAMGEPEPDQIPQMLTAEVFLCLFITLQMVYARIFEPDLEDSQFEVLKTYPVQRAAIFLAKFFTALIISVAMMIPIILFACLILGVKSPLTAFVPLFATSLLALVGLIPLGIILAVITAGAFARQILYPILYFPLTTPALLAAVYSGLEFLERRQSRPLNLNWLLLLGAFDVIYFTLAIVLFIELLDIRDVDR